MIDPEELPALVSRTKSFAPELVILPDAEPLPTTTSPVPFVFNSMFPFAASTIVILELELPAFVSSTRSNAPEEVIFPAAAPLPITTSPVPLLTREILPLAVIKPVLVVVQL